MKWRILTLWVLSGLVAISLSPLQSMAATSCDVKILEIATSGVGGETELDRESQDILTVKNMNPTTSATVQLVYYQANGLKSEANSVSLGTIAADTTRTYVSPALAPMNPSATVLTALSLAQTGGTVLVQRTTGAVFCDEVGWGTAVVSEALPAIAPRSGETIYRISSAGTPQDSNNNAADFRSAPATCSAPEFSEVQPFVTDQVGGAVEAWVELSGMEAVQGDCQLISSNGDSYTIPAVDLPGEGQKHVINRGLDANSLPAPLHLGETGAQLWMGGRSVYMGTAYAVLPRTSVAYPALERGQTWSLIDGLWRATYAPTPYESNTLLAEPLFDDSPGQCGAVRITELMPNPSGEDIDSEWIELYNGADEIVMLGECQIEIDGALYGFSLFDGLGPDEYRTFASFYDSGGTVQNLTLRNGADAAVSLAWERRVDADHGVVIQSFDLYDGILNTSAPEAQSWARFADGWRWAESPTPGQENLIESVDTVRTPTETPAADSTVNASANETVPVEAALGLTIQITELLPNPAAPATDETDEYVELYNPNDMPVNVAGYTLQTGTSFNYKYVLPSQVIEPGAYLIITSGTTSISLSNTAGQARILDAAGNVLWQTDPYLSAPEGVAWVYINGVWKWSATPTKGAANLFTDPKQSASTAVPKSSATKTTAPKTPATKATTTTPKAVKAAKTATDTATAASGVAAAAKPAKLHIVVLAAIGLLGVLYAAYEYRTDIANRIHQFRRYRASRRASRERS